MENGLKLLGIGRGELLIVFSVWVPVSVVTNRLFNYNKTWHASRLLRCGGVRVSAVGIRKCKEAFDLLLTNYDTSAILFSFTDNKR